MQPIILDIIDTETTGLRGKAVELAILRVNENLEVVSEYCQRINPEIPIEPGAQAIHGISDFDVQDKPTIEQVMETLGGPLTVNWVGHNAPFDKGILKPHIVSVDSMCTLALARQHIRHTTNHKLTTLGAELDLEGGEKNLAHSALGDCYRTRNLIRYIIANYGVDLATMWARANEPKLLAKMPWGKHKGITMTKLPPDYVHWLNGLPDLDRDMRFTVNKLMLLVKT